MKISVKKLTDDSLAREACSFTLHSGGASNISMKNLYGSEHSPIRTQIFWVEMDGIPSFVSTHLVRHKVGVEHFVQTYRDDRGADSLANRETPVRHAMLINAQALINMARKRLCMSAHTETREVMVEIKEAIKEVDDPLDEFLVSDCMYRGRCYEPKGCGLWG